MRKVVLSSLLSLISFFHLHGEVEEVVIRWNALLCLDTCTPLLTQNLQQMGTASNIRVNPQAGTAVMSWNPGTPFSFQSLNFASRATGIRLSNNVTLKVHGTIAMQNGGYVIISSGDNTVFPLLGSLQTTGQGGDYVITQNIANYAITPAHQQILADAAQQQVPVTVQGILFEPYRYSNGLIIQQISAPKPNPQQQNAQRSYP